VKEISKVNGEKPTDHKEQYGLNQPRFQVEPFEYFRVIKRELDTDPEKTPEIKVENK